MKKIITTILFGCILVMSCKKEKSIPAASTKAGFKKVKEVTSYFNGNLNQTDIYTYDPEGRISSVSYPKNIHSFEYPDKNEMKVTAKNKATGEVVWIQTAKLNSKGAITEITKRNLAGTVVDAYYYSYDANGYMISYKYVSPIYNNDVQERFFVFENGNAVAAKTYINGVQQQNYIYEYDLNELSIVPFTPDFYWMSETLYGTPNKNPRKSLKSTKVSDGTIMFHALYSRIYNNEGNMLEENILYPIAGTNGSLKYKF